MIKEETLNKIIENLEFLTLQKKIVWKDGTRGTFYTDYDDTAYDINMLYMTVNGGCVGIVFQNEKLMKFYDFLNDIIVGETTLAKLNAACEGSFLGVNPSIIEDIDKQ